MHRGTSHLVFLSPSPASHPHLSLCGIPAVTVCPEIARMAGPGGGPSRKSHTKSRNGCKTCKKRHIRCDETVPQWCVVCSIPGLRHMAGLVTTDWLTHREVQSKLHKAPLPLRLYGPRPRAGGFLVVRSTEATRLPHFAR